MQALVLNRPFNRVAGKHVWRLLVGRDGAHGTPRLELTRQLRASQIAAKCAQIWLASDLKMKMRIKPLVSAKLGRFILGDHLILRMTADFFPRLRVECFTWEDLLLVATRAFECASASDRI